MTDKRQLPDPRDRLPLGRTGLTVSPFCLGIAREPGLVTEAFRCGINFFFVSTDLHLSLYLNTILGIRELLGSGEARREDIVVAAVSYVENPKFLRASLRELLWLLPEIKSIDVLVAGGCSQVDNYIARRSVLADMKNDGTAVGASFHSREAALLAITRNELDIAYVRYNPAHPGAKDDSFPFLGNSETRVFNFLSAMGAPGGRWAEFGLGDEYWRPTTADYYRFAFTQPRVDGILFAPRTARHLKALSQHLALGPLDDEEEEYLCDLALIVRGRVPVSAIYKVTDDEQ